MLGINHGEQCHTVLALGPIDIDSSQASVWARFGDHTHLSALIALGVTGAASTITVEAATDVSGTNNETIAFKYYPMVTASGDVGPLVRTAAAAAGFATSLNNGVWYWLEIDAEQLPKHTDGTVKSYIRVIPSDPAAATFGCLVYIFSGGRFAGQNRTLQT